MVREVLVVLVLRAIQVVLVHLVLRLILELSVQARLVDLELRDCLKFNNNKITI